MIVNPITITVPRHVLDELMNAGIQRLQRLTPGSKGEKSMNDALDALRVAIRKAEQKKDAA